MLIVVCSYIDGLNLKRTLKELNELNFDLFRFHVEKQGNEEAPAGNVYVFAILKREEGIG